MMAVAIQKGSVSYDLIGEAKEWVLAVPGTSLVQETLFCGTTSMREVDKVHELGLELCKSAHVSVPGIRKAIANVELRRVQCVESGDHIVAIGQVLRFSVKRGTREPPLLSIGPNQRGYELLAKHGIHRIAVARTEDGTRQDVLPSE
jgi:flavin reductase (DIM6/NTAB) family NADH-FMN oxidoreductase RutF